MLYKHPTYAHHLYLHLGHCPSSFPSRHPYASIGSCMIVAVFMEAPLSIPPHAFRARQVLDFETFSPPYRQRDPQFERNLDLLTLILEHEPLLFHARTCLLYFFPADVPPSLQEGSGARNTAADGAGRGGDARGPGEQP